jgi:phosphohistidine phosphatase
MLRLMLMRHAKSSWSDSTLGDMQRPLNARGREASARMVRFLAKAGLEPELVLASPARRVQETIERIEPALAKAKIKTVPEVYDFGDGSRLLEAIRQHGGEAGTLMVVGHNPAIGNLAEMLVGSGEPEPRAEMARKFPTAALAVIEFKGRKWSGIGPGKGTLSRFVRPRALSKEG